VRHHPCFHKSASRHAGRIHLPVAADCNIQCNYCNRNYDCVNESRPGVTSSLLQPDAVIPYLRARLAVLPSISVVGIAGPGDPLADAKTTLQICRSVQQHFPEMLLCLSTNGLNLADYADALADAGVTHVTVTVNAVCPEVGTRIYQWVADGDDFCSGLTGAGLLWGAQMRAIHAAKRHGLTVKVNTVVIRGFNDAHVEDIARSVAASGADVMNCIPMIPIAETPFGTIPEIDKQQMRDIVSRAARHVRQVRHCIRCRADAAGMLCHGTSSSLITDTALCLSDASTFPIAV
jgi:nitrogen fixation protein NifB